MDCMCTSDCVHTRSYIGFNPRVVRSLSMVNHCMTLWHCMTVYDTVGHCMTLYVWRSMVHYPLGTDRELDLYSIWCCVPLVPASGAEPWAAPARRAAGHGEGFRRHDTSDGHVVWEGFRCSPGEYRASIVRISCDHHQPLLMLYYTVCTYVPEAPTFAPANDLSQSAGNFLWFNEPINLGGL